VHGKEKQEMIKEKEVEAVVGLLYSANISFTVFTLLLHIDVVVSLHEVLVELRLSVLEEKHVRDQEEKKEEEEEGGGRGEGGGEERSRDGRRGSETFRVSLSSAKQTKMVATAESRHCMVRMRSAKPI